MSLYDRQKSLGLNIDTSVTILGSGGIGFWVTKFAAMSGINKIYVFDPDVIEENNLNRLDLPMKFVNRNKADIAKIVVNSIRPECNIYAFPFKFSDMHDTNTDWIIDCTDNYESQINNQKIAKSKGIRYLKAGYDGESFSINNKVAEWGDVEDGYQITPSWIVPAVIVAAMTVAKVIKYNEEEIFTNVKNLFKN